MKIEFEPKAMKDFIVKVLKDCNTWEIKKQTELTTVRMKFGWYFHKKLAVHYHYHLFPDCDDPKLISKCMTKASIRKEWDKNLDEAEELTKNGN